MSAASRAFSSRLARPYRRRFYAKWLATCCALAVTAFLFSSSSVATEPDRGTKRNAEVVQAFLQQDHDKHSNNAWQHAVAPDRPAVNGPSLPGETLQDHAVEQDKSSALQPNASESFPSYDSYLALVEQAADLPEHVYIPFEDAVSEDHLVGWEAEWLTNATYDAKRWGHLSEPKIDFVYTWVNGSEEAFRRTRRPYELNSTLNDRDGDWLRRHGENRYRDWNELKYSVRSLEKFAPFINKIQVLVNSMDREPEAPIKQTPTWLDPNSVHGDVSMEVLSQNDFFEADKRGCLPTFNSLTIKNQLHNTDSAVDRIFALSDDMLLGKPHAAADIYSPLFGPTLAFKTNGYNVLHLPNGKDAHRFGEKPWLIYTSWLLNRRFGFRKRKGQAHFGHSLSRKLTREALRSFPGPELQSACSRFRGDFGFQLYSWYATFHYTIERHREALLWSYLVHRSDPDQDGFLSWSERQTIMKELTEGLLNEQETSYRAKVFYQVPELLEDAGLRPPRVNVDVLWTSLDGPLMTKDLDCFSFDVNECLASGFSVNSSYQQQQLPVFSTAAMLDRVAR